jgi:CBS domain protein
MGSSMTKIDLSKPSSTPRPLRMPARPLRAYIMLGFGALDLLERSPIGVVFILIGCYLLYRGRAASVIVPELGTVGTRRADEVMALAPTALPDWWTIDQYRARAVPVDDAEQPAFPLVDLQGKVTGAIARADLEQVARTETADVRLRDLARRVSHRPMVLITRESSLKALAGPVMQQDAIAVVVNADQHPLGVVTRSEIAQAKERAA